MSGVPGKFVQVSVAPPAPGTTRTILAAVDEHGHIWVKVLGPQPTKWVKQ